MWKFDPDDYMKRVFAPAADLFAAERILPDVFARYALDLDCSDAGEIEQAVRAVTAYWVKQKNNIKYKRLVEVLLQAAGPQGSIDLRTLKDPIARAEQRKVVEAERKQQQQACYDELNLSISGFASKGYITPAEKRDLIERYMKEGFKQSEIVSLIHVPEREARKKLPTDQGVDAVVSNQIRTNLATLKKRDLYEFLGVDVNASPKQIQQRHFELTQEWNRRLNDFDKSAANVLLSIVQTYFFSGMQKYENSRVATILERLRPQMRLMAADKRIAREEFEHLLGLATKHGLEKNQATDYILSLAEEYGASLEWSAGEETISCAFCSTHCPKSAEKCKTCGSDLRTDCPKCRNRVVTSQRACSNCGFVVVNFPRVKLLVRQAQLALEDRDLTAALSYARQAKELWGRSGDVALVLRKIEASRKVVEEIRERADKALAERRLFAARQILAELMQRAPQHTWPDNKTTKQIIQEMQAQVSRAEMVLQRAAEHERNRRYDDAVFAYLEALNIAADADEARTGLKRHPPQPVSNVRASLSHNQVLVQWSPSVAVGDLEYVVVRRESRASASSQDGQTVCRTTSTACEDLTPRPGSTVFYTVFAVRGGAVSTAAASQGLLITLEVSNFRLEAGDGIVLGTWTFDPSEGRVRIFCREGQPPDKNFDREVNVNGHSFRDSNLKNGRVYYYRAQVEYRDMRGAAVLTTGVVESIKPEQPPNQVDHIAITCDEGLITLTWNPPAHGTVIIYRNSTRPNWQSGAQIPLASASLLGARIQSRSESQATDSNPPQGTVYYTPLTVSGDVAIVGSARRFVAIPDVANLAAEDFVGYLQLRWEWPTDCQSALVAWRSDAYPEDHTDTLATLQKITRGQYEREGAFRVENPAGKPYRFVVFAALEMGGETVYSSGIGQGARAEVRKTLPVPISYTLSRGTFRRRRFTLVLSTESDITGLPDLIVVAKPGGIQPLHTNDGDVVSTLSAAAIRAGQKLRFEFEVSRLQSPTYFRAFFREATAYRRFRLIEPPPNQLLVT